MRKVLIGVMLSLLPIATCFITSCTKVNNYGSSTSKFTEQDSVKMHVSVPTDFQFPLSEKVIVTVSNQNGTSRFTLDKMWPQGFDGSTTEYVGHITTHSITAFIHISYCSINYTKTKTVTNQQELNQKIRL
jgi:hypothetical protein